MSFHPSLGQHSFVSLLSSSASPSFLHFTYHPSNLITGSEPQVWTSLPSSEWQAIPFALQPSASAEPEQEQTWLARIPLADAQPGRFEYTFRLLHADGSMEWLGSEGGNGVVELVIAPSSSATVEDCPFEFEQAIEVEQKGRSSTLAAFGLKGGRSDQVESFRLRTKAEAGWDKADGLVIERSERTWYLPRLLPSPSPLSHVSPIFDTLFLHLRRPPTSGHSAGIVVILAFSTSTVSSSLRGGDDALWLRCTRDSDEQGAKGYVAVAWGKEGELRKCTEEVVRIASEVLGGGEIGKPSKGQEETIQKLSACTWNALNYDHYTLSDVLPWLEGLKRPGASPSSSFSTDPSLSDSESHHQPHSSPLFASSLSTILLDDGWQDVVHFPDPVDPAKDRRGLRSFGVRPEWYDVNGSIVREGEERGRTSKTEEKDTRRDDSGYGSASMSASVSGSEDGVVMIVQPGEELKDAVERIKRKGIEKVGVWMTLEGYWDALAPTGPLADKYGPLELWTLRSATHSAADTHWYLPPISRLADYYHDYFSSLKRAGIDFVKVDDQAHQDYVLSRWTEGGGEGEGVKGEDAGELRREMLTAMRREADKIFGAGTTIHCMSGSPRTWGGELGLVEKEGMRSLIRNSDDYFPDTPSSHRFHLHVNALNTLLTRSLALVPDFDMCQERLTDSTALHPWGTFHISFRAFSPAPTYSTDVPAKEGLSSNEGWEAMLGWTKDGAAGLVKTNGEVGVVLEGRIFDDVLGEGQGEALKVGLPFRGAKGAHVGLWNVRVEGATARSWVDDKDVADAVTTLGLEKEEVVVYLDGEDVKQVSVDQLAQAQAAHRLLPSPLHPIKLEEKGHRIVTIAQLHSFPSANGRLEIACLGLLDKHTGLAALQSIKVVDLTAVSTSTVAATSPDAVLASSTPAPPSTSLASRTPSTFPRPPTHSRLAFLLTCLTSYRSSLSASTIPPAQAQLQPRSLRTELHSLGRDLLRRPLGTIWSETRAVVGFTLAIVLWSVGRLAVLGGRPRGRLGVGARFEERETAASVAPVKVEDGVREEQAGHALRVGLAFVSPRLGFYLPSLAASSIAVESLKIKLDGTRIPSHFVSSSKSSKGVVEVDVEGAWRAAGESRKGEGWVLEVSA
ncbi:hypothetical protein BCR35DRAFT_355826 [Leucosporidium creatinivorum]|uniref:Alpha-galactosidase n=1 Tax=Leucosporidium creatinivorum TaxID=106004 RepID=A0A1Y2D6E0_9BASI|nr:hypothetical protein BCR35DRAFT_355826 [Leucosporidium creatinivorum]